MKRVMLMLMLMLMCVVLVNATMGCVGNEEVSSPFGSAVSRNDNVPVMKFDFSGLPPNLTHLTLYIKSGDNTQWAWSVDGGSGGLGNQADPTVVPAAMNLLKPPEPPATQPAEPTPELTSSTDPLTPEPLGSSGIGELEAGSLDSVP